MLLVFFLRSRSPDSARHLFGLYLIGLLFWGVLIFLMRSSPDLDRAQFWENSILPLALLETIIIYHFSVVFCSVKVNKWVLLASYAVGILVFGLSYSGWVVAGMQMKPYGYAPVGGPLFLPVILASNGFVAAAILNLSRYSRKALFKEERNRSIYILLGLSLSMLGGTLICFL